jgi:hypothetical protein
MSGMTARSRLFAFALVSALGCGAWAGDGPEGELTVHASDLPADAPRPEQYPAVPYAGPSAAPDVRSDPRSRAYRTQIREWAKERPNFAGHYILATWGCGTGCTQIAIIDAKSGKVFHPPGIRMNQAADVDEDVLPEMMVPSPRRADFDSLRYRPDSRLLVLLGTPENEKRNRGISYFVWEREALRRVRLVAK